MCRYFITDFACGHSAVRVKVCHLKQPENPYPYFLRCDSTEESINSESLCDACKLLSTDHGSRTTDSAVEGSNRMNPSTHIPRESLPASTAHRWTVAAVQESELFFSEGTPDEAAPALPSLVMQQEAELFFGIGAKETPETCAPLIASTQQERELFFDHQPRRDFSAPARSASAENLPRCLVAGQRDD